MDASEFPSDSVQGFGGYCCPYHKIPHETWLRVESLEIGVEYSAWESFILTLLARNGNVFQVYASPRILAAIRRYQDLQRKEMHEEKKIYFKYKGKIATNRRGHGYHDFRLLLH